MTIESPRAAAARTGDTSIVRAGVYGASGTTGTELIGVLSRHPRARIAFATSRGYQGRSLRAVDPAAPDVELCDPAGVDPERADVVFVCLPHGHAAGVVERIAERGVKVIDLSGDLRLRDAETHARVYGSERAQSLAERAVYGLTEIFRADIAGASVVTNPGCYPTCTALALAPLVRRGLVRGSAVVDAKSGVSGAGRGATPLTHFCAAVDDVRPYKLGRAHRHVAEIDQTLAAVAPPGRMPAGVVFSPHVVPIERGMLATIVVTAPGVSAERVRDIFLEDYDGEPFVDVLPLGEPARIRAVARTNRAAIGVSDVEGTDQLVLTSVIDNLLKGAAGQAVQNLNVMLGLPETTGLEDPGMSASPRSQPKGATA